MPDETAKTADGAADAQAAQDAQTSQGLADAQASDSTPAVGVSTSYIDAGLNPSATDPSDTYTHGVAQGNVNSVVPEGAFVVDSHEAAQEHGYYGYAPGHEATKTYSMSAQAAKVAARGVAAPSGVEGASLNAAADSKEAKATAKKGR